MKAAVLAFIMSAAVVSAAAQTSYEVWTIDQSNSPGKTYGGILHIWNGTDLENQQNRAVVPSEKIDLGGNVSSFCMVRTGANPVRPHMLAMNASQTHAIISFVASGHVVFLNAGTREPVACIRSSVGADGARQVHFAIPSADETYVAVANQNGKLFERINTNYATNTFVLDVAAGINLATCTTPNGVPCQYALRPDNAPICPIIDATSRLSFVTLRGGGLFVVDSKATPMKIVGEYDTTAVAGNGCLGAEVTGVKMYIDSGAGGVATNPHQADLYSFPITGYSSLNLPNTPARRLIFREEVDPADAHGAALTKDQKHLWVADRGRNFIWVVDTETDLIVNRIFLAGLVSADPTPDLLGLSPDGNYVHMSLRGPTPLTADPHVSTGATPGVGIIKITEGGRNGVFESLAPISNIDSGGIERADAHALTIRTLILPSNVSVGPGLSAPFPVVLPAPAGPNGVFVTLMSSNVSTVALTPSGGNSTIVFIKAGAMVPDRGTPILYGVNFGSATITATIDGVVSTSQTVQVTATLSFAPGSFTMTGSVRRVGLTLNLSAPAPAGGVIVNLSSENTDVATVPATVAIPANSRSVVVPVTGVGVGSTVIHASALPNVPDTTASVTVQ